MADSKKGEVVYEIRADDSKVESDLEQANRKVEKAVKQSADDTVKIEEKKTSSIRSESGKVVESAKSAADTVTSSWKKSGEDSASFFGNLKDTLTDTFTSAADSSIPLVGEVGNLTKGLSGAQVAAIGAGAAAVGVGVLAVGAANDLDAAMNQLQASTGITSEQTKKYRDVLEDIYNNGYGDSFADIGDALSQIRQQIGPVVDSWDPSALQSFTESAIALRDTLGYDITESVRAADTMMEQFGIDGQYAFDLIAKGAQNGLDYSGELIDSINEYSVHFQKMGLYADDMFKIFQAGADSGAFNLDKIGDAVKEMSIRVVDGSDTTRQGFEALGLDADEMAAKFAAGGDSAKEAFQQTIEALDAMEDPLAQNTAGVNLFGTMWEDLGADAVTALADIQDGYYATGEEMENLNDIKYDDLGAQFEQLKRNVETAIIPIGEALIPLLSQLAEAVLPLLSNVLAPLLEQVAAFLAPILDLIVQGLGPLVDAFVELINVAIMPLVNALASILLPVFESVLNGILGDVGSVIGNITAILTNLVDFIKNVLTGNWKAAWENIKNIFSNIVSGFGTIFKAPLNWIIDGINGFINGVNKIKVPDWVPVVGGKGFNIPKIPRLKVGMDYVPSDRFPALLDEGEWVLTKEEANLLRSIGGLERLTDAVTGQKSVEYLSAAGRSAVMRAGGREKTVVEVPVYIDGREVARASADYMGEQMDWEMM